MLSLLVSFFVVGWQVLAAMFHRRPLFQYYAGDMFRSVEAKATHIRLQRSGIGNRVQLDNAKADAVPIIRAAFRLSDRMADEQAVELAEIFLRAWAKPDHGIAICPCVLVKPKG